MPSSLHTLDYLGRSITLDIQSNDWIRAKADSDTLSTTWASLIAQVRARRGGPAAAAHFGRTQEEIARAVRARDSSATLSAAKDSGSAVDQLEKMY